MKEIIMYSSETWPHCHTAKEFLNSHGFKYKIKDANDPSSQQEMLNYNMRGVPSFFIDGEVIVGFNKEALLKHIDFKIFTCNKCQKKMRVPKDKGTILLNCSGCGTKYKVRT